MSNGWLFLIMWTLTIIVGAVGFIYWANRPADEYDLYLEKMKSEEEGVCSDS